MKPSLLFLLSFFCFSLHAQQLKDLTHHLQSEVFEKQRTIKVYLPERYFNDSTTQFSVTYLLDAQSEDLWNLAKGQTGYLVNNDKIIPTILVGIVSDNRWQEFTPPSIALTQHISEEIFPFIQQHYRINNHRTIIGHSWGGAFVTNTLFSENANLFNAYLALSPSIEGASLQILQQAKAYTHKEKHKKYLFASVGDLGRYEILSSRSLGRLDSILQHSTSQKTLWNFNTLPGKDHWSSVIPGLNQGLLNMSRNYWLDHYNITHLLNTSAENFSKTVNEWYQHKSKIFGFSYQSDLTFYRYIADDFRDLGEFQKAIMIYKWILDVDEYEITTLMNFSDTYVQMQEKDLAKAKLEKTIHALNKKKDELDPNFYKGCFKWAQDRLKSLE